MLPVHYGLQASSRRFDQLVFPLGNKPNSGRIGPVPNVFSQAARSLSLGNADGRANFREIRRPQLLLLMSLLAAHTVIC